MTAVVGNRRFAPKAAPVAHRPAVLEFLESKARLLTKAEDLGSEPGVVEALVAITGNTDDGGDVIQPGAFNFKRAPKIVWSHNLRELVGKVLVYEEWKPGDVRLPVDLRNKGLGALYFKMQFDLEDPESFKAYRKVVFHEDLGWSIGYETDPKGFKVLSDGRRSLTKIYVWEGSPTTFGMNQEARTVSVKSLISSTVDDLDLPAEKATAVQQAILALLSTLQPEPDEEKAWAPLVGSFEETQGRIRAAIESWAVEAIGERTDDLDWYVSIEGTFEDSVVGTVRIWKGEAEGGTYRWPYTEDDDGGIELGEAEEVEITADIQPATGTPAAPIEGEGALEEDAAAPDLATKMADALVVVTELSEEVKAGRVLSAANAARLRQAQETISQVLAAAEKGETDDDEKKPKAKAAVPVVQTKTVQGSPAAVALSDADVMEMLVLADG